MNIILLLAGLSRRCGDKNKLLEYYNGSMLFTYPLSLALNFCDTIVVTGYENDLLEKKILSFYKNMDNPKRIKIVFNPSYKDGQLTSLCRGLESLESGEDFAVFLGDMPKMTTNFISELLLRFDEVKNICDVLRPFCDSKPFHPVLFTSKCRDIILKYKNKSNIETKYIIEKEKLKVMPFSVQSPQFGFDVDYLEDFRL